MKTDYLEGLIFSLKLLSLLQNNFNSFNSKQCQFSIASQTAHAYKTSGNLIKLQILIQLVWSGA